MKVRFGSTAALHGYINPTAASGGKADVRRPKFPNHNLNDRFPQYRPFSFRETMVFDRQLTARTGHSLSIKNSPLRACGGERLSGYVPLNPAAIAPAEQNPWGKIPALRIDDEVLTETHAILSYIGDSASSDSGLIPRADPLLRARAHQWLIMVSAHHQ